MAKTEKSVLKIIIKGEWFDEIASKKKIIEYREYTSFWISRLYDKDGKKRQYDQIEFINGYNADSRRMITEYNGFNKKGNELQIHIGKIIKKEFRL